MGPDQLVAAYLEALAAGDVEGITSLFAPGGRVHSPLYGVLPATEFYPALFADTRRSVLRLRQTLQGESTVAFWFDFDWVLGDGTPAPFTVVDVAELDPDGRVTDLHITYDTHPLRGAWEQQRAAPGPGADAE